MAGANRAKPTKPLVAAATVQSMMAVPLLALPCCPMGFMQFYTGEKCARSCVLRKGDALRLSELDTVTWHHRHARASSAARTAAPAAFLHPPSGWPSPAGLVLRLRGRHPRLEFAPTA
jgi:hypothetical protein